MRFSTSPISAYYFSIFIITIYFITPPTKYLVMCKICIKLAQQLSYTGDNTLAKARGRSIACFQVLFVPQVMIHGVFLAVPFVIC